MEFWVYLYLDVCAGHNLVLARYWSHSLAAQLCIKQCFFRMTWWQYFGFSSRWPLWGAHLLTLGASQPPTHWCLWFPWLAPHLVLRGASIIPQELIAHLITVGNTWPFLQREEDEKEGQKKGESREIEESKKKKKTSGEICLSNVVNIKRTKNTNQTFLKHESPLMELSDKSHSGKCECFLPSVWVCVLLCQKEMSP